jgi:hypothetical protein
MATGDDSGESASVEIEVFACTGPCDQPSSKATTVNTSGQRFHNATLVPAYFATSAIAEAIGLGLGTAGGTGGSTDLTFLFGNLSATAPLLDGVNSLIGALLPLEDVVDGLAAWGGLTSEHAGYWEAVGNGTGLLPAGNELDPFVNGGASLFDIPLHSAVVGGIAGVLAFGEGAVGGDYATTAACGGGPCPGLEALTAVLVPPALADLAAFPATYTPADFDVIGSSPTKVAGIEPYDNNSVFAPGVNPQDFDNQTYSDLVAAGGGDEFDFVALAAGLSLFGAGSPFLPVGGALLIGILAGGLAALGARRLRRS